MAGTTDATGAITQTLTRIISYSIKFLALFGAKVKQ